MTDDHESAYDSVSAKSNERISLFKWRVVMGLLALTMVGGVVLTILLLRGLGDPPYAARLVVDLSSDEGLTAVNQGEQLLVSSLPDDELPVTIEAMADARGEPSAIWGIWVRAPAMLYRFQIRNDGYFSVIPSGWQEFIHIQPAENKLYLHIESDGAATFRINDEIAWVGVLPSEIAEWGIIRPIDSPVNWRYIHLFAG